MVIGRRSLLLAGVAVPVAARGQCVTDTPSVDACLGGVRITQPPGVTLDLSFLGPTLDARITFTRASTATYFDSSGTMQTAGYNLVFPSIPAGPSWTAVAAALVAAATAAPDGTTSGVLIREDATSTNHVVSVPMAGLVISTQYTVSFYAKAAGRNFVYAFGVGLGGASLTPQWNLATGTDVSTGANANFYHGITNAGNGWYRCWFSWLWPNLTTLTLGLEAALGGTATYPGDGVSGAYIWGAQIEAGIVASTYAPTTTAANGAPRFDYDPVTHAARGLLLEEARTNVVINSVPPGANWFPLQTTQTAAAGIAPDGTNTMVRLAETATTNNHIDVCNVSPLTASVVYNGSVYAKAAENRYLQLVYDDNAAARVFATFDLVTGTITGAIAIAGTAIAGTASINAVGGGIYRCSISGQIGITSGRFIVALSNVAAPAGAFPSYAGNAANGLLFWGAQLELGAFPTSYVPTTGAAVTRAVEACTMPTSTWFNAATGSLAVEAYSPVAGANAVSNAAWAALDDGTFNSVMELRSQQTLNDFRMLSFVASVNSGASAATGTLTPNTIFKGAATYNTAPLGAFAALNGAAPGVNGISGVPSGIARLVIGQSRGSPPNNAVRRVRYWPRVLSNAEMQSVTR